MCRLFNDFITLAWFFCIGWCLILWYFYVDFLTREEPYVDMHSKNISVFTHKSLKVHLQYVTFNCSNMIFIPRLSHFVQLMIRYKTAPPQKKFFYGVNCFLVLYLNFMWEFSDFTQFLFFFFLVCWVVRHYFWWRWGIEAAAAGLFSDAVLLL